MAFRAGRRSSPIPGDNTEKVWAHQFLTKPKTIAAGGLGGVVSP